MVPDCRAWELVNPVDKNGGNIELEGWNTPGSLDGNRIVYLSRGSFSDTQGSGMIGETGYIAERGPTAGTRTQSCRPARTTSSPRSAR